MHFDTHKLNKYLQKKCIERNITIQDDTIKEVKLNKNGIESIKGKQKYTENKTLLASNSEINPELLNVLK